MDGSPLNVKDLVKAGVDTAAAAIVLASARTRVSPDQASLVDDVVAISVSSTLYK